MVEKVTIWTIGHSSRSWAEFVDLLREFQIEAVCDVRAWPSSRKYPHFRRDVMESALAAIGIAYHWRGKDLGGRRNRGLGDASPNLGLRAAGFRNYADHMRSASFHQGLEALVALADRSRAAVMCAEALYWRCHRWLLSDALAAQEVRVMHILGAGTVREHRLSDFARIVDGYVTYPPAGDLFSPQPDS